MSDLNNVKIIDIIAADKVGHMRGWSIITTGLVRGLAPENWKVIWHYKPECLIEMALKASLGGNAAKRLLVPDVVVMFLPATTGEKLAGIKVVLDSFAVFGIPLVLVSNVPSEKLTSANIQVSGKLLNIIYWPPDPKELVAAIENILGPVDVDAELI